MLPQLGEVRRVTAVAGFKAGEAFLSGDQRDIRTQASADPLGCLGDVGWYNIRAIMFANGWELPKHVIAHALEVNEQGVPIAMAGMSTASNQGIRLWIGARSLMLRTKKSEGRKSRPP